MRTRTTAALCLAALLFCRPAFGFITRLYSLKQILDESTHVAVGKLAQVDAKKGTAVAAVAKMLKGKREFKRIQMNFALGPAPHQRYMKERLKSGAPVLFFYQRKGNALACCAHTDGTWFQLFTTDNPRRRDRVWWRFSHVEIYLPRTFNGSTPKLTQLTAGVLSGRIPSPKPDKTAPLIDVNRRPPRNVTVPKVAVTTGKGGFHRQVVFKLRSGGEVRAVSWIDVNGDETLDLFACRGYANALFVNQGKSFKDIAAQFGLRGRSRTGTWADYNGDGHPDLLTSNFELYTNVGGKFRNDSKLLRPPRRRNPEGAGWIDYNGDGRPDILITNGEYGIQLFENTGRAPAWFRDVSGKAGLGRKGLGAGNGDFVAFFDYDGDGYTDFLYNLGGGILAHNEGNGTFKLDKRSGIRLDNRTYQKRGVAVGDYDNDGDLDLFIPGPRVAQLYRNNNDGTFTNVLKSCGDPVKETDPSFAAAWGDVNGDGHLDLFVCHTTGSTRLYVGDGRGRFRDVSAQAGVKALSPAYGAAFADADGDGDLDLAVNLNDRVVLAMNDMTPPKKHGALLVRPNVRKGIIGAVVRVLDEQGKLRGMRELTGAESCGGQATPVAHFGLPYGKAKVTVALSNGRAAQKTVTIGAKPTRLTIADGEFK